MADRPPDFELKVWLTAVGYQADVFYNGKEIASKVRDFRHELFSIEHSQAWLLVESFKMVERLRRLQ